MAVELPHLPDLPNAGYATPREKQLTDSIMFFMRGVERDRLQLLSIVLEGRAKWRKAGGKALGWLRVDTDLLDSIFSYFELQACRPGTQQRLLQVSHNPAVWRAIIREAWPDIEAQRDALRAMERRR